MSISTKIQWCDSTVNPVMGCEGCELWPTSKQILSDLIIRISTVVEISRDPAYRGINPILGDRSAIEIWHNRNRLIKELTTQFPSMPPQQLREVIESRFKCYAGHLHLRHGENPEQPNKKTNSGYARIFEEPRKFPGRMAEAAELPDLTGTDRPGKPWLNGHPRLIFVSDMGDALSDSIDNEFLKREIIDNVDSEAGKRHVWLWLTKRPDRMTEFGHWLQMFPRWTMWPRNLVAMTSITGRATTNRIDQLREGAASFKGLSVEPLSESVELDLEGINWVIVGGESGGYARPFDLEWARGIRDQCQAAGVAFFVKQLGANVVEDGFPIPLVDSHGGDLEEWPTDLRVRDLPAEFLKCRPLPKVA